MDKQKKPVYCLIRYF